MQVTTMLSPYKQQMTNVLFNFFFYHNQMHTTQFTTKQYLFGYSDVQKTALMGYSDVLFRKLYGDILLLKNVF